MSYHHIVRPFHLLNRFGDFCYPPKKFYRLPIQYSKVFNKWSQVYDNWDMEKFKNIELKVLAFLLFLIVNECSLRFNNLWQLEHSISRGYCLPLYCPIYQCHSTRNELTNLSLSYWCHLIMRRRVQNLRLQRLITLYFYIIVDISFITILCQ